MRPLATWNQLAARALRAAHGIELEHLLDRATAIRDWKARDVPPEQVPHEIDAFELAVAQWLAKFEAPTRTTYQRALRGLAKQLSIASAKELIVAASLEPADLEPRLKNFARNTALRTGTRRQWLTAIRSAVTALVHAGHAARALEVSLPPDADRNMTSVRRAEVDELDGKLRMHGGAEAARTRCAVLLAYAGLATRELLSLTVADLDLDRSRVQVRGVLVSFDERTRGAIERWLMFRSRSAGPLFVGLDAQTREVTAKAVTSRQLQRSLSAAAGTCSTPLVRTMLSY